MYRWQTEEIVRVLSGEQTTVDDPSGDVRGGVNGFFQHGTGSTLRGL